MGKNKKSITQRKAEESAKAERIARERKERKRQKKIERRKRAQGDYGQTFETGTPTPPKMTTETPPKKAAQRRYTRTELEGMTLAKLRGLGRDLGVKGLSAAKKADVVDRLHAAPENLY